MLKAILISISSQILLSCVDESSFEVGERDEKASSEWKPIEIGKSYKVTSNVFGTNRNISIRLPQQYFAEPEKDFPVIYLIDGGAEQDFPHIAGILQSIDINWTVEPMILVGVETVNRAAELTPPSDNPRYNDIFPERGGADEFRAFLEGDVIPWVEAKYRTDKRRVLLGESLAGLFVTETYLNAPSLFTHFAAVSPSLWWDELAVPLTASGTLHESDKETPSLYLTMGNEGGEMQRGLDVLIKALQDNEVPNWTYVDRRNHEDHGTIYHPAALDMLRTYFSTPYRVGTNSESFWMFKDGMVPPLSDKAKDSIEKPCDSLNAQLITFEAYNEDPETWRGMCVIMKAGQKPTLQAK